ncbi:hypothetical protein CANCADRAFT_44748 [Tortispora caseinolytica NRRL Y-17796]|uniref:Thioesterase domain-containing protein n=1 Tax=Tortispora caseinolytica NRRL Y-17796 TaxID=767744 RepID=A0A1E4THF6_9ASCO|nr:hypothetical protein CANCADRAFT_44748 [Tortispora caseinolytica NRRL Y-17796]
MSYLVKPSDYILYKYGTPPAPGTPEAQAHQAQILTHLNSLKAVKELRSNPDFQEVQGWDGIPGESLRKSYVYNTLIRPGIISVPSLVFVNRIDKQVCVVTHLGHQSSGIPTLVHGGLLATLLDEALGRTSMLSFGVSPGVTANLTVNYKAPTLVDQCVVIRTNTESMSSRKAVVTAEVYSEHGKLLVNAYATFVMPKNIPSILRVKS